MQKTVLLTGANGMLGNHICRALLNRGYKVRALCLAGTPTQTLEELPIEIVLGNVLIKEDILHAMESCSYVIHAAALTDIWPRKNKRVMAVNFEGTQNVMEAATQLKVERMIYISSASTFSPEQDAEDADESDTSLNRRFELDYITSKFHAQKMLMREHNANGFPVIIINPTYMIGSFGHAEGSGKMLLAIYNGSLRWYCNGGKNFVCASDVAEASVQALTNGRTGHCYIAGNENLSYHDFFYKVHQCLGRTFTMRKVFSGLLILLGILGSSIALFRGKAPVISFCMARIAIKKQYYSVKKARRELGMPQTPVEVGITECMNWFRDNKYI